MKFKFFFSFIFFTVIFCDLRAQVPSWEWEKTIGGTGAISQYATTIDDSGNFYCIGIFFDSVDFDPSISDFILSSLHPDQAIFFAKYDKLGNLKWAKHIDGLGYEFAFSIERDKNEDIYISGQFWDTLDFDPDVGVYNLMPSGDADAFVAKYNSFGNLIWAKSFGGLLHESVWKMKLDGNANIYLSGPFSGTVDFDPGSGTFYLSSNQSLNHNDLFVSKLDSSGSFIWAKSFNGKGSESLESMAIDSLGNIYTTGRFGDYILNDTVDFDPGSAAYYLTSNGHRKMFISKLDSSGNFIWVERLGDSTNLESNSILLDALQNVYITGGFAGTKDFNPDTASVFDLHTSGNSNGKVFLLKLDSSGNFIWAHSFGGLVGSSYGESLISDSLGNIYVGGAFSDTCDFNPDLIINFILVAFGNRDLFVSKFNDSGNFLWCKQVGGIGDEVQALVSSNVMDDIYLSGVYTSQEINFDSVALFQTDTASVSGEIFISKLKDCISFKIINISSCYEFISPSGNYTWSTSGIYHDTIPNAGGCDSIITINLTINSSDTSITQTGVTLTANATTATYQWLNCDSNFTAINGATNQTFTATANGNYAVVITQNGCTETSACYSVTGVGVSELAVGSIQLTVFTNPAESQLTVQLLQQTQHDSYEISITDILGREILRENSNLNSEIINLKSFASGIYFLKVISADGNSAVKKFVKQ